MICSCNGIKQLGTILGIWAHPDDEAYFMAGIMAAAVQNGQVVACITATRGEAGIQDESRWPRHELADIRTAELNNAYNELGVKNHHWLDYPDGCCNQIPSEDAIENITELIQKYHPDSILTFDATGMTGHPDHQVVSHWVTQANNKAGGRATIYHAILTPSQYDAIRQADEQFNIFFNTDKPPLCNHEICAIHFELDDELYDRKIAALTAMRSQTEKMFYVFGDSLRPSLGTEAYVEATTTQSNHDPSRNGAW